MKNIKYKLNIIFRFSLAMIIGFIIIGTMGYISTSNDCDSEQCRILVCLKEGDFVEDSRTGQSGNICDKYDIEYYPAKKYILKQTIAYGFAGGLGLGFLIGWVWTENYKKRFK